MLSRLGCAASPAFGSSGRATCSSSLALAPAGSGAVCIFSTAVAAIPGGSSAVLRRRHRESACCEGCRPGGLRLKTLCPPGVWLRAAHASKGRVSFVPASQKPPQPALVRWSLCNPGQAVVPQSAVPVAGLSAARLADPRRGPAMPPEHGRRPKSGVAGNGLSGKRNDRFVAVVIW